MIDNDIVVISLEKFQKIFGFKSPQIFKNPLNNPISEHGKPYANRKALKN
jgi:hypothetical protein